LKTRRRIFSSRLFLVDSQYDLSFRGVSTFEISILWTVSNFGEFLTLNLISKEFKRGIGANLLWLFLLEFFKVKKYDPVLLRAGFPSKNVPW